MKIAVSGPRKAEFFLVLTTLIWGGTFAVIKNSLTDSSPLVLMGFRFSLACICFTLLFYRSFSRFNKHTLLDGTVLGILMFIAYAFQTLGLEYTTASRSGFITYSFALFTPPLQYLILGKKPKIRNLAGLAIVFIGLYLVSRPERGAFNRGDILTLICAVSLAFYVIYLDRMSKRSDTSLLTIIQFLICGLASFILSPFLEQPRFHLTMNLTISILYLAILGSVVGIALMIRFQKELTPTKAVIIYALEPLFSVFIAIIFLEERLSMIESLGCIIIVGGVMLSELKIGRKSLKQ